MKKVYLLLALILIAGCQNTFEGTFNKIEKISKEHDTSFFTEELNRTVVPLPEIMPLIKDIESVKADDNASERFIEARINMLRSQLYWQLAMNLGSLGRADDGFYCKERP